ncbi:hypothetical protein TWF694_011634 [Orbilia ellipsospora]|uniref:Nephrocystin 3-like N-terminal domain-containing protein n=1 Tax=Orbilia ellipsospora TaxID=2528407 RepID=A0AAV9X668_9PEZI
MASSANSAGASKFFGRLKRFKKSNPVPSNPQAAPLYPDREVYNIPSRDDADPAPAPAPTHGHVRGPLQVKVSSPPIVSVLLSPSTDHSRQLILAPHRLGKSCLSSTRVDVLSQIAEWASDPDDKSLFWLTGRLGEGKSTILRTVARDLENGKAGAELGACWLFHRKEWPGASDSVCFVRAIAAQLAARIPSFSDQLEQVIDDDLKVLEGDLEQQFIDLVLDPLEEVIRDKAGKESATRTWVLAVDGIDRCHDFEARTLVRLLFELRDIKTTSLKIIITSKPEFLERLALQKLSNAQPHVLKHVELSSEATDRDLSLYLNHELSTTQTKCPGDEEMSALVALVTPSFYDATMVSQFLASSRRESGESVKILLKRQSTAWSPIEEAYRSILNHVFTESEWEETERLHKEFQDVAGSVLMLADTLSLESLSKLLSAPAQVIMKRTEDLYSLLGTPLESNVLSLIGIPLESKMLSPINNQTFQKYLLDSRNRGSPFWIDEAAVHVKLANSCLKVLRSPNGLKENICNLSFPSAIRRNVSLQELTSHLPEHLQYACRYWIYHLKMSNSPVNDGGEVDIFFRNHFLNWVEVLSSLGEIYQILPMLETLHSLLQDKAPQLRSLVHDSIRFVFTFRDIIHDTPLQLYSSALLFLPETSLVKQAYESQVSRTSRRKPIARKTWPAVAQILVGHEDSVNSVRYSPDGRKLISASDDKTVRIWNSTTGQLQDTLKGHMGAVTRASFSPADSRLMVSVGSDRSICMWTESELTATKILDSHRKSVNYILYTPDGKRIVSSSNDIRIRDAETGALVKILTHQPREHKSSSEYQESIRIALSPDGTKIISVGWYDGYINIWDAATGENLHWIRKSQKRSEQFGDVVFLPDGKHFATIGDDVKLWNLDTREIVHVFNQERGYHGGSTLAVSPCGKFIAASSDRVVVNLWNVEKRENYFCKTINVKDNPDRHYSNNRYFSALTFSPDGKKLAAAEDYNVYLLDLESGDQKVFPSEYHYIYDISFSPDGTRLACGGEKTLVIVDAVTGDKLKDLPRGSWSIYAVTFSPDGERLAAGADTGTLWVWGIEKVELLAEADGHKNPVRCADFSSDGKRLVTASNESLRVWDALTGRAIGEGHLPTAGYSFERSLDDYHKYDIVISLDGKELASGTPDKAVRWWNVGTGEELDIKGGHTESICAVARSYDGTKLATAGLDMIIMIWDWNDRKVILTLKGLTDEPSTVAFSPDGAHLASCAHLSIFLWETIGGTFLRKIGLDSPINDVTFSPDGETMAAAMYNGSILLLDKATLLSDDDPAYQSPQISVTSLEFSPNRALLAAVKSDHTVRLINPVDSKEVGTLTGHNSAINSAVFLPCSKYLVTASDDCTIKLWSVEAFPPTLLHTLKAHESWVRCAVFSPDGKVVASAADDHKICIWSFQTGKLLHTINDAHEDWIRVLAFSPSGEFLASASDDKTVKVWSVTIIDENTTVTLVTSLTGHKAWIKALGFSDVQARIHAEESLKTEGQDYRLRLASAADDGLIRIWDVLSGEELDCINGVKGISKIRFSQNGKWLDTNRGHFSLEDGVCTSDIRGLDKGWLYVKGNWICRGGERVMCIPDEYAETCAACDGNGVLALGSAGGLVSLYEFN